MFELKVSSLRQALELSQNWATHTISLLDPDYTGIKPKPGQNALLQSYYFHDVFKPSTLLPNQTFATAKQIQDILEFTETLKTTDKLLVHCHAGISRSTAVGCGVLCQHGLTPSEAIEHILSIRQIAWPNAHIIALFDEILVLDGELIKTIKNMPNILFH
ncbi:dual specificity protein phosphatase family protein [Candidatus Parabeggiatoa sp. HSG14]|uniref:dual specificity protein phosphatase family protein n=1 Tax=Candidatus Parabeggiatoa sp. HSG14 TaxID=3055593 RepID=UPI0025A76E3A|nr:dual specificity protein phosphatase family protein [Thiotrichales bacterium HSG14]